MGKEDWGCLIAVSPAQDFEPEFFQLSGESWARTGSTGVILTL